jgi:holo-[acyl-carrier protein] synthase
MILGIGVDVAEIARIARAIEQRPRFLQRIFTPDEQSLVQSSDEAAGRWAAKEAIIKSIGYRIPWHQMEILRDRAGKPLASIKRDIGRGPIRLHVTITHDAGLAIAFAVMETADN